MRRQCSRLSSAGGEGWVYNQVSVVTPNGIVAQIIFTG